ncbi:hypothetical protein QFZ82_001923 [Streptomyces sp. V4I23]|nr:hypothetical protein [Streptomyces sp. V4I23]
MGKRRTWELLQSEESKVPVPPRVPRDHELISGDPVYFGKRTTTIGYDERTLGNSQRVARESGKHDVIVHGTNQGVFLPGRMNVHVADLGGQSRLLRETHTLHRLGPRMHFRTTLPA